MSKVLVIGCGGVASVAISKCCQVSDVFTELCIASRTKSKCDALAAKLAPHTQTKITTAQVDADDVQQLCDLINAYKPDLVMNIALPYQDLTIMDACLACGVNYMDTANYEPENTDDPEWRAVYEKRCKEAGELLNLTQIETGKLQLMPKVTKPIELIDYAVAATRVLAERFGCFVEVEYPEKIAKLFIDSEKIAWVVTNLLSNAIHHLPEATGSSSLEGIP